MCKLLDCQDEVNHNIQGADSSADMPNDKTIGLYLVCCHYSLIEEFVFAAASYTAFSLHRIS